jgi:hypothetical protein
MMIKHILNLFRITLNEQMLRRTNVKNLLINFTGCIQFTFMMMMMEETEQQKGGGGEIGKRKKEISFQMNHKMTPLLLA